jgi:hypothetical protein
MPISYLDLHAYVCKNYKDSIKIEFIDLKVVTRLMEQSVYTQIHTFIRTYIHTYVHSYVRRYVHMYICTYIRTYGAYVRTGRALGKYPLRIIL